MRQGCIFQGVDSLTPCIKWLLPREIERNR